MFLPINKPFHGLEALAIGARHISRRGTKASALRRQAEKNADRQHPSMISRRMKCWPDHPETIPWPSEEPI